MIFDSSQIIVLSIFLAVLIFALVLVKRFQPQLRAQLRAGKRITISESTSLGGQDRALLVAVDAQEFLVVLSKKAGTSVTPLVGSAQEVAQ